MRTPSSRRFRLTHCSAAAMGCALLAGCGPGELPAFANPPPDDAGSLRTPDAGSAEDAGQGARDQGD